jgi:hypothetical protein
MLVALIFESSRMRSSPCVLLPAVPVISVVEHSYIDVDDVAFLELDVLARNTMANDFVDRCAHTLGKTAVVER